MRQQRIGEVPRQRAGKKAGHGYGLTAMRNVTKKYNSVLLINSTEKQFEVKSCFCLTGNRKQGSGASLPADAERAAAVGRENGAE